MVRTGRPREREQGEGQARARRGEAEGGQGGEAREGEEGRTHLAWQPDILCASISQSRPRNMRRHKEDARRRQG